MNSFEYITVLVSIVIGLAIADIATSLHRLLRAGRRVRWDWIAPTAAALVLLELFNLWWKWHGFSGDTLGEVMPYFAALLLLFLAASASLPDEVPADGIDLREFERSSHTYFWSVYIAFVVVWIGLRTALDIERGVSVESAFLQRWKDYAMIALYCVVIVARRRWLSFAALAGSLLWLGYGWWSLRLSGIAS
ncbi:hypothetical protein [Sphingomonas mesophila]|uniref:hypothetical protein n=1 Tax=Sphingomonas mesophila TaxID=2303576 RepID=UPI000E575B60|nr:hypothetical protein [Sphingomonas mesophila]